MAEWIDYGVPRRVPNNARMAVLTNEQINLIASLVVGTNDVFSGQIPGPFYVDQREEAIIFHRIDFYMRSALNFGGNAGARSRVLIDLQYSDMEPAADWNAVGEDTEDENIQAMFDGPFLVGQKFNLGVDTDAPEPVLVPVDGSQNVHYWPPDNDGLDAFFPVTFLLTNVSSSVDTVDLVVDAENFTNFEHFGIRYYFTTRPLTQKEKDMMTSEYYGIVPFA